MCFVAAKSQGTFALSLIAEVCKANTMPEFVCCMQGSFAKGAFAAYNMYEREVELSEVPNGNMEDS